MNEDPTIASLKLALKAAFKREEKLTEIIVDLLKKEDESPFSKIELLKRIDHFRAVCSTIANPRVPNTIGPLYSFTELNRDFLVECGSRVLKNDNEIKRRKGVYAHELS